MLLGKRTDGRNGDGARGSGATVIAQGVKLQGDFTSQGDVVIEGEVQGHVETAGQLTVGAEASVKADVSANDAFIAGAVEGTLSVQRRLELKSTARVIGDLACEIASIEAGAILDGKVHIGAKSNSKKKPAAIPSPSEGSGAT